MADLDKIKRLQILIAQLANNNFTGRIEIKFYLGGVSLITKFEELQVSEI